MVSFSTRDGTQGDRSQAAIRSDWAYVSNYCLDCSVLAYDHDQVRQGDVESAQDRGYMEYANLIALLPEYNPQWKNAWALLRIHQMLSY